MQQYHTRPGDLLDAICHKYYQGRPGATEAVLEANPGLARMGAVLPEGLIVALPELPAAESPGQVSLWD
jgi:phage tail protein X